MITRIRTTVRRDKGASAVEYGLIVVAIAAVVVAVVFALGLLTKGNLQTPCTNWNTAQAGSC